MVFSSLNKNENFLSVIAFCNLDLENCMFFLLRPPPKKNCDANASRHCRRGKKPKASANHALHFIV